eukprot:s1138_g12.t1
MLLVARRLGQHPCCHGSKVQHCQSRIGSVQFGRPADPSASSQPIFDGSEVMTDDGRRIHAFMNHHYHHIRNQKWRPWPCELHTAPINRYLGSTVEPLSNALVNSKA